jgi:hypothetical protein
MKLLHTCGLVFHGLIAWANAHECLQVPADWHKYVCAGAYVALTIVEGIIVYLLFRERKSHSEG